MVGTQLLASEAFGSLGPSCSLCPERRCSGTRGLARSLHTPELCCSPMGTFWACGLPLTAESQVSCAIWSDAVLIPLLSTVTPQDSYLTRDSRIQADQDGFTQLDPPSLPSEETLPVGRALWLFSRSRRPLRGPPWLLGFLL